MCLFPVCKTRGGGLKPAKTKVFQKCIFTLSVIKGLLFSVPNTAFKRHEKQEKYHQLI